MGLSRVDVPDRRPSRAVHVLRHRSGAAQRAGRGLADHTLTLTSDQPTVTLFASLWRVSGGRQRCRASLVAPIRLPVTPGRPTTVTSRCRPRPTRCRPALAGGCCSTSTESTYANSREPSPHPPSRRRRRPHSPRGRRDAGGHLHRRHRHRVRARGRDARRARSSSPGWQPCGGVGSASTRSRARRPCRHPARRRRTSSRPMPTATAPSTTSPGEPRRARSSGLLGPNGAGKTTTMRMVMGLIAPDAGGVHVLGEPVSAGSDVLERVGALIEGPGFLPHLTGRQNLEAYWAATGRRPEDAHIDEALDVAALGGAVDRPVRSYSHGMKQRLGIAQAMLGLPGVARPRRADERPRPAADRCDAPDPAPLRRDRSHRRRLEPHARRGRDDVHPCRRHARRPGGHPRPRRRPRGQRRHDAPRPRPDRGRGRRGRGRASAPGPARRAPWDRRGHRGPARHRDPRCRRGRARRASRSSKRRSRPACPSSG